MAEKAFIEYRVRATGPSAVGRAQRIYGPFKDAEKARKSLDRTNDDWEATAHISPWMAGVGPFVLEARYVGPWEPPEDAHMRRDVCDDNLTYESEEMVDGNVSLPGV